MSSKYYSTVYDIVQPIANFLHPIRVEGLENVPKDEPVLLCPNHSSNWDPILLIAALGRELICGSWARRSSLRYRSCAHS